MSQRILFTIGVAGALGVGLIILVSLSRPRVPIDPYEPGSRDGQTIFIEACAKCHGIRGEGSPLGPRLAGRRIPTVEVEGRVKGGGRGMPRFSRIQKEALEDLAAYINRL